jgi:VWFA-related protein
MKSGGKRPIFILLMAYALGNARGQNALPPASQNTSASHQVDQANLPDSATIRVSSSVVLVPTLVEKKNGAVLYGLTQKDFLVEDNGVPQRIHVDDDLDSQPVSIVIAVEKGRTSLLEFQKIAKLGPLLDLFLGDGFGSAALVSFDSQPALVQDFTPKTAAISRQLRELQPGDGGAAILDAVRFSIDLLERQPQERRRILLLISESRDHGSMKTRAEDLVERVGTSNTLVLALTYSASGNEFVNDLKGGGAVGPTMNLLSPLMMAIAGVHKNVPKQLAVMSGGEYAPFFKERGFEERVEGVARHARNRYILSFRPTDKSPGFHTLKVSLTEDYGARLVARESYWALSSDRAAASP